MHRRTLGALVIATAVSALTITGCGSGKSSASGVGTAVTTAGTPSTSSAPSGAGESSTSSTVGVLDGAGTCPGLGVKIVPLHGAAAGSTYADLVVDNQGKSACTLPAQPKLEYLDANHKLVRVRVSTDSTANPFTLASGTTAAMAIGYGSDGNPPCDVKIAYIRVTPPGDVVTFDGRTHCAQDGAVESAWVAGSYAAP